jgi:hypothetical protein
MLLSVPSAKRDIYTAVQIRGKAPVAPAHESAAPAHCRASGGVNLG